jgi:16S rRNA processing protein RimM
VNGWDEMVLVGRIARPHGLKGQVIVTPETDFVEERFALGSRMWTRRGATVEPLTVASMRVQSGRPIVGFAGLARIEDVEALAGCELRVPETELQPLETGRFYEYQLAGCEVETLDGTRVGTVAKVEGGLGGSRLVVQGTDGEVLIPFVAAICTEIDVDARRIRIDPPEGLIELNRRT